MDAITIEGISQHKPISAYAASPPTPHPTLFNVGTRGYISLRGWGGITSSRGCPLGHPPDLCLYSDAPRSEWGAHLLDQVSTWTMVETGYLTTRQRLGVEILPPSTTDLSVHGHRPSGDSNVRHLRCSGRTLRQPFRHPWDNLNTYAFPPLPPVREGSGSGQRDPGSLNDPSRAPLAREGVVRGPTPSPNPAATSTPAVASTATPIPLPQVPRRHPRPEPSRVASLKRLLSKSGFSREGAHEMSKCVREPTARLYQSQWLSFCNWCRRRGKPPIDATIPLIVDFLIHLRRDKGFSLSALKGYRAAINSVLALKGTDLSGSRELAMLFCGFAKSCPTTDLRPPAWDVALVLNSLTAAPYEPIKEAEERLLAHKSLFLLTLASAKSMGELHALSHLVSHSVGWKEGSFSFVPGFVAKTQDQSSLDPRFESFTVPALPRSRDSPDGRLLCPVRAVKHYLSCTAGHRPRCERLFITSGRTKKEISKNTVSFWLCRVISLAYQLSGKPLPTPSPLARETRGIAPSLLFKKNYAVSQVLKAGTWRRHTTFTRHYLRDLSHKSLDTFHLGPVVAVQATF